VLAHEVVESGVCLYARTPDVETDLEELRRLDARALREGFREAWAVERGLQLGSEIVLDVDNHILTGHFGVSAQDYEDIIAQLGAHSVIGAATSSCTATSTSTPTGWLALSR
jgi:uncharacterized protein YutE (UPF0331/DUF86 family)